MAQRGLAAARGADDGSGRPLGDIQRYTVDDGLFAVGEMNVLRTDIMLLRTKLRT